ncbi:MAG: hypothetical protein JJD92_11450 [Frankiaceae bacterium]|nr:hypothetical protein [Frankiaceae bacterium]
MANGQAVLPSALLDVGEVDRLTARLETREVDRHRQHAEQLIDALALDAVYADAGMALQTAAVLALTWHCSEQLAAVRLHEAHTLRRLGALEVMRDGLLTVEQGRVLVDVLGRVDDEDLAAGVWERLRARLEQNALHGAVLPPARTAELLRRWLLEADPQGAIDRRREAEDSTADVDLWRRDDGLNDLAIRGLTGPNAQACAQTIRDHADPIGSQDQRPVGRRMRDAAVDLILGRTTLPFPTDLVEFAAENGLVVPGRCGRPGCGCAQGQPVPCGVNVQVLVPLTSALGASDAPAELVGQGPIDPDLLQALLLADPVLTRVWVDPDTGTPIAVDDRTWTPGRADPQALRDALLDIASGDPPTERIPIHPDDHPLPAEPIAPDPVDVDHDSHGCGRHRDGPAPPDDLVLAVAALGGPELRTHPHPAGTPGPYVLPRRLRRLVLVRSPRCEWPGCGRPALTGNAAGCDVDHDLAWPAGPTCGCNTGPLCRRHHRIKQLGWTKERRPGGHLCWISQTGRRWLSRNQHQPPTPPVRPLPPVPRPHPLDDLSDLQLVDELWHADPADSIFDTYPFDRPTPEDIEPLDEDILGARYDTRSLWARLDDPTAGHEPPPTPRSTGLHVTGLSGGRHSAESLAPGSDSRLHVR